MTSIVLAFLLNLMMIARPYQLGAQPAARNAAATTAPVPARLRMDGTIKVLQHDRSSFARAPRLKLEGAPLAIIGGPNGDVDLTYVAMATVLSDGRLTIISPKDMKYELFGANGKHERTLARRGSGPGELSGLTSNLLMKGDTLFVFDGSNMLNNWFHPDKGLLRSSAAKISGAFGSMTAVGLLPRNRIVFRSIPMLLGGPMDKVFRPAASVGVVGIDGNMLTIAQVPDWQLSRRTVVAGKRSQPRTVFVGFTPRAHVTTWDTSVVTGSAESYRIEIRNASGNVQSCIVADVPRMPVTRALRDWRVEREMQQHRNEMHRGEGGIASLSELETIERETPVADSLPAYEGLYATTNGLLWVVDGKSPLQKGWSATAFSRDGAIVGRLSDSADGTPIAFGKDRVVVRSEDEDGVVTFTVRKIGASR